MIRSRWNRAAAAIGLLMLVAAPAAAQEPAAKPAQEEEFVPQVGQAGKDVVWVPTPPELVDAMLDLAKVTPQDYVIDLGSGDGRNVIAAAKRGARALGVEYNPKMVSLSQRNAAAAGVADRAKFVEGDMYKADISQASVMALFLLPSNMLELRQKFLDLKPGSRIVANTFGIEGWTPDDTVSISDQGCSAWCTALLWIVPAKVAGNWRASSRALVLSQEYQVVRGTFDGALIADGKLRGDQIRFTVGTTEYTGRVTGNRIEGTARSGGSGSPWSATRSN